MREKLINEMKAVFGEDKKRIDHALAVLANAEKIHSVEGGDSLVITAAAILHDIGIHAAEEKYGSSAGKYQEIEGPDIAREILEKYDISPEKIEHICRIIGSHHSANDIDTIEFRTIWDADWLVNIVDDFPDATKEKLKDIIDKVFKTRFGLILAEERFLRNNNESKFERSN